MAEKSISFFLGMLLLFLLITLIRSNLNFISKHLKFIRWIINLWLKKVLEQKALPNHLRFRLVCLIKLQERKIFHMIKFQEISRRQFSTKPLRELVTGKYQQKQWGECKEKEQFQKIKLWLENCVIVVLVKYQVIWLALVVSAKIILSWELVLN